MKPLTALILSFVALLAAALGAAAPAAAQEQPARIPVLLDTDLGDDVDDAFALALVLASPELELCGVTTVAGDAWTRALIVRRWLYLAGRDAVPVAAGAPPRKLPEHTGQMQFGLRAGFGKPPQRDAVEFLYAQLKARPGAMTILALGPLTNVAELLHRHPDCKPMLKRIVLMGGSVRVGYDGKKTPEPEWNIKSDIKAARVVFASGVPLVIAPLDATGTARLEVDARKRLFARPSTLTDSLHALYQLWGKPTPILFDPIAVALCFNERFCTIKPLQLSVDDRGMTLVGTGRPNARVATAIRTEAFVSWFVERLTKAAAAAPATGAMKRTNVARPVERSGFPKRVHVVEDYETNIERRWWLAGVPETKDVPPGSQRACRGVLCNDFDDRGGDRRAAYTTVIFNPVPGPPMGRHTRLSFRCKLTGSDALKVQLYSLSVGAHRHLTLTELPQGKWQTLTVDMTQARRASGGGIPLAEGERIDDIQFYADRGAELLIDDVILYDAAPAGEMRPFPKRVHFTGWFDTGRQGQEWPGTFTIVSAPKPRSGRAAQSVKLDDGPGLRIGLRGERPLGRATRLRFRYLLKGTDHVRMALEPGASGKGATAELRRLTQGAWSETTVDLSPARGTARTVVFRLPAGAEMLVDDLLLFESGD